MSIKKGEREKRKIMNEKKVVDLYKSKARF